MIKTRLETLLEEELSKVGITLRDRIYYEDFLTAAEIDGVFRTIPNLLTEEMIDSFSDYQRMAIYNDEIPLFRREAHGRSLKIFYEIYCNEKLEGYKEKADDLIKKDKIHEERVLIFEGKEVLLDIFLEHFSEEIIQISMPNLEGRKALGDKRISFKEDPYYLRGTLREIRNLNNKKIKSEDFCKDIVGLLLVEDII